jgi:hypothetical protein
MWRLAYRNKGAYESMVTNQSVEALPGVAGVRWYELRRTGGTYSVFQQGTYAPNDGVHRWMGSIAADKNGNMALGYSVVNGTTVFPGIRYTGRLAGDPLGQMTLGEGTIVNGTASQTHTNSRWGDYTSLNVDPVDDCTLWYVNEYYTVEGAAQAPLGNGWQTRIASFRRPGGGAEPSPLSGDRGPARGDSRRPSSVASLTRRLSGRRTNSAADLPSVSRNAATSPTLGGNSSRACGARLGGSRACLAVVRDAFLR